jgi:hypothetical protein
MMSKTLKRLQIPNIAAHTSNAALYANLSNCCHHPDWFAGTRYVLGVGYPGRFGAKPPQIPELNVLGSKFKKMHRC